MKTIFFINIFFTSVLAMGQELSKPALPYHEIPPYPEKFTASNVAARMIDGLGFRYYWATEGLRDEDLSFKPSAEARTSLETIRHIYDLTLIIVHSVDKVPNVAGSKESLSFSEMRKQTLNSLKSASDRLKMIPDRDLNSLKIIFKSESGISEFPFWNQINGPIADTLWHVGQVVSLRRSSGNPFNENADVFSGTVKE